MQWYWLLLSTCSAVSNVEAAELKVGASWPGSPYATIQAGIDAAARPVMKYGLNKEHALSAMINVTKKVAIYGGFTGSETLGPEKLGHQCNHCGWPEYCRMLLYHRRCDN